MNIVGKDIPKISGKMPVLGHAVDFLKRPLEILKRGYEEHGNIFGLEIANKKAVVILGPENNKFFFNQTDKLLSIKEGYPFFQKMFSEDFYFLGEFEDYKKQRSVILPCFHQKQMHNYINIMIFETMRFMDTLGESGSFDMVDKFGPLVMNIAAHSFLGENFRESLGGDAIFDDFRDFSEGMDGVLPLWLPIPKFQKSKKAKAKLHKKLQGLINERRANPMSPPDFFQNLVESTYEDGEKVSDETIIHLILLLVWAGHETTTGHTSWAMYDLLNNRNYLDTVLAQQKEVLGKEISFSMQEAYQLKRMDWTIKETERLHPVAYVLFRFAKEDFELQGFHIPKGTLVFAAPSISHMMPDVFPEPEQFDPLRFSQAAQVPKHGLIGFGGGVHRCAGVNFAYLEMKVILTVLLQQYDFELYDHPLKPISGPLTKWPASPCRISYWKKEDAVDFDAKAWLKSQNSSSMGACPFHKE